MTFEGKPLTYDPIFEDLRKKGHFWEAFVHAWGFVESDIDFAIVDEFGLMTKDTILITRKSNFPVLDRKTGSVKMKEITPDPRILHLLRLNFDRKIEILTATGRIAGNDIRTIKEFANKRNELYHGNNYEIRNIILNDLEKENLLNLAAGALSVTINVANNLRIVREKLNGVEEK